MSINPELARLGKLTQKLKSGLEGQKVLIARAIESHSFDRRLEMVVKHLHQASHDSCIFAEAIYGRKVSQTDIDFLATRAEKSFYRFLRAWNQWKAHYTN